MNLFLISLFVFLKIWRFYIGSACLVAEGVVTHTDYLIILAETLFYLNVLTFFGFWFTGIGYGIPAILVAVVMAFSLLFDVRNAFSQNAFDHKSIFTKTELSKDSIRMVKRMIIVSGAISQFVFFFLLWIGGLFSQ